MKLKNSELIVHINHLNEIVSNEKKKTDQERLFSGRVNLLIVRNLRAMYKEYQDNYEKDLMDLKGRYFTVKKTEQAVTVDGETKKHAEAKTIEVLKPDCTQDQYDAELNTLLELKVSVPIRMIRPEDVEKVTDFETLDKLDFMIE